MIPSCGSATSYTGSVLPDSSGVMKYIENIDRALMLSSYVALYTHPK